MRVRTHPERPIDGLDRHRSCGPAGERPAEITGVLQNAGLRGSFFVHGQRQVSVSYVKVNDRQFIELIPRSNDSQPGGILHTCFEVADIEALHRAYVERGLQPTEPKKARAGNLLFVMHGPDNQLLEYTQYMPDSLHSQSRGKHLLPNRVSTHMVEADNPGA